MTPPSYFPKDKLPFPKFDLAALLEERDMGGFVRGVRPRDHLYASELGYCPRAVWLGFKKPRPDDKEFREGRGALGHAVEDLVYKKLNGFAVEREVSFRDERVSGRVDFVMRFSKRGPQIPLEVKSTYAYSRFVGDPMWAHLLQVGWYLTQMPEAPYGLLLYYSLEYSTSAQWTVLKIPRDDEAVKERVDALWKVVHSDKEPPCREGKPEDCFDCSNHAGKREGPR